MNADIIITHGLIDGGAESVVTGKLWRGVVSAVIEAVREADIPRIYYALCAILEIPKRYFSREV